MGSFISCFIFNRDLAKLAQNMAISSIKYLHLPWNFLAALGSLPAFLAGYCNAADPLTESLDINFGFQHSTVKMAMSSDGSRLHLLQLGSTGSGKVIEYTVSGLTGDWSQAHETIPPNNQMDSPQDVMLSLDDSKTVVISATYICELFQDRSPEVYTPIALSAPSVGTLAGTSSEFLFVGGTDTRLLFKAQGVEPTFLDAADFAHTKVQDLTAFNGGSTLLVLGLNINSNDYSLRSYSVDQAGTLTFVDNIAPVGPVGTVDCNSMAVSPDSKQVFITGSSQNLIGVQLDSLAGQFGLVNTFQLEIGQVGSRYNMVAHTLSAHPNRNDYFVGSDDSLQAVRKGTSSMLVSYSDDTSVSVIGRVLTSVVTHPTLPYVYATGMDQGDNKLWKYTTDRLSFTGNRVDPTTGAAVTTTNTDVGFTVSKLDAYRFVVCWVGGSGPMETLVCNLGREVVSETGPNIQSGPGVEAMSIPIGITDGVARQLTLTYVTDGKVLVCYLSDHPDEFQRVACRFVYLHNNNLYLGPEVESDVRLDDAHGFRAVGQGYEIYRAPAVAISLQGTSPKFYGLLCIGIRELGFQCLKVSLSPAFDGTDPATTLKPVLGSWTIAKHDGVADYGVVAVTHLPGSVDKFVYTLAARGHSNYAHIATVNSNDFILADTTDERYMWNLGTTFRPANSPVKTEDFSIVGTGPYSFIACVGYPETVYHEFVRACEAIQLPAGYVTGTTSGALLTHTFGSRRMLPARAGGLGAVSYLDRVCVCVCVLSVCVCVQCVLSVCLVCA